MNESVVKVDLDDARRLEIAVQLALRSDLEGGESPPDPLISLQQAAVALQISTGELTQLLNEPKFIKLLRGLTRARAALVLHGAGVEKLAQIVATGKPGQAMQAIRILGQLTGDLKTGFGVDIKISFEQLMERHVGSRPAGRLNTILDIKEPPADE